MTVNTADKDTVLEKAYLEFTDCRDIVRDSGSKTPAVGAAAAALSGGGREQSSDKVRIIDVQFNPGKLSFRSGYMRRKEDDEEEEQEDGRAGKAPEQSAFRERRDIQNRDPHKKSKRNPHPGRPSSLTLSVELIFDGTCLKSGEQSVRMRVEALLEAAENPFIRQVSFNWGTMYYEGRITGLDVQYVMFDGAGEPLRANVDLSMELTDTAEA